MARAARHAEAIRRRRRRGAGPKRQGLMVGLCLGLLRGYQWFVSPLFPPCCRYTPTCSQYAVEAVRRYGVIQGGWLSLKRLLRCHPFARGGYDPLK